MVPFYVQRMCFNKKRTQRHKSKKICTACFIGYGLREPVFKVLAVYTPHSPTPAPQTITPAGSELLRKTLEGKSLCPGSACCLGDSLAATDREGCSLPEGASTVPVAYQSRLLWCGCCHVGPRVDSEVERTQSPTWEPG